VCAPPATNRQGTVDFADGIEFGHRDLVESDRCDDHVLFELVAARRAGNERRVRAVREEPGETDLRCRPLYFVENQTGDDTHVDSARRSTVGRFATRLQGARSLNTLNMM
jgi:hypothetical protein